MAWSEWEQVVGDGLEFTEILYHKKEHLDTGAKVARVTINRPKQLNSFTAHTQDEMFRAFYEGSHDPLVAAIVLTGTGDRAFSTGGDVAWEQWGLREQFYWRYLPNRLPRNSRRPVIAAIRGYCIGGGHHLAYTCDFSVSTETAIFGQNGPRVSSPADGYIIPYSVSVVGAKKARELWMLCRRYTAQEALEMGLVNSVVPDDKLDEEVDRICEDIIKASPGCIEILKGCFDAEIDHLPQSGLQSSWQYHNYFDTEEGKEGSMAFMEKRKPNYWAIRKKQIESGQL